MTTYGHRVCFVGAEQLAWRAPFAVIRRRGMVHGEQNRRTTRSRDRTALTQTAYYLAIGIWLLVDIESFEWVTGRKVDRWLVKTIGGMLTTAGAAFGIATCAEDRSSSMDWRQEQRPRSRWPTSSMSSGRIWPVYLLDTGINLALIASVVAASGGGSSD